MYCNRCGAANSGGENRCRACGYDLSAGNKKMVTYDYKTVTAGAKTAAQIIDIYETLGWELAKQNETFGYGAVLSFRRDRKIKNREQLNRIQVRLDDALSSTGVLEKEKTRLATAAGISIGTAGTLIFGGGMCLCLLNPVMWSYIVGSVLGVVGGGIAYLAYLAYKKLRKKKTAEMDIAIEKKRDEISRLCEDAQRLFN